MVRLVHTELKSKTPLAPDASMQVADDANVAQFDHSAGISSEDTPKVADENARPAPAVSPESCNARLAEIKQMFLGKTKDPLEMASYALEYHDIYKKNFAQNAQKPKIGRPGVVSAMARELAVPGSSDPAKRAWIERALKVARMSPEAVAAATKAKLQRNRRALIEISEAGGAAKQLQKIEEIKQQKADSKKQARKSIKKIVRFAVGQKDEVMTRLVALADEMGFEVL